MNPFWIFQSGFFYEKSGILAFTLCIHYAIIKFSAFDAMQDEKRLED